MCLPACLFRRSTLPRPQSHLPPSRPASPSPPPPPGAVALPVQPQGYDIELRDVHFAYRPDQPILQVRPPMHEVGPLLPLAGSCYLGDFAHTLEGPVRRAGSCRGGGSAA